MGKACSESLTHQRQQQLLEDRMRTQAISRYLTQHKVSIAAEVSAEETNRNKKRKAMERIARARFKQLPEEEQHFFVDEVRQEKQQFQETLVAPIPPACSRVRKVRLAETETVKTEQAASPKAAQLRKVQLAETETVKTEQAASPKVARRRRSSKGPPEGSGRSGVRAFAPAALVQASAPVTPRHTRAAKLAIANAGTVAKTSRGSNGGVSCTKTPPGYAPLRHRLASATATIEKLYGDAGAAEVLAASYRILRAVLPQLEEEKQSAAVKVAVIAGLAAKLTQTGMDGRQDNPTNSTRVSKLWASIAGRGCEASVVRLEPKVLTMWAAQSLESEYWPQVMHPSGP